MDFLEIVDLGIKRIFSSAKGVSSVTSKFKCFAQQCVCKEFDVMEPKLPNLV